ncbi:mediator of RNA polymerase II transcription subunit 13 isoform X4 [Drosophila mauritiana]|uniref:Mediator of RNA polymerase II transcription subunit 13 isoform X4 n=1 Tax=Drosophila mauritiana TaxID=7226 RepID=A0A6P8JK29_DROMA|nr:mediator of RNA polymerase II transcription subunit 13 isoform X4 [Drosophila mauritiana]
MDLSLERDSSALGSLFQQIINDMKNTSPLWEDFVAKAGKLHTCLRAAIQAIAAYLDAFQKIADAATNSRGASKEIGTALTRVCLRHKAVETRLKTFTSAIMDCLVQPLQERIEDWKRTVATIDKDHAKEYKRCRSELKKRSSDTLRLQKKARKGQTDGLQSLMDSHMQDVTLRRAELEEVEKKSLRAAMVEERLRYCSFVHMLQPVVHEECEVMSELGHLQEAMQSIALVTKEPSVLPQASEELIHDAKASINLYPESPGGGSGSQGGGCSNSLGSRKSSVCSISSMNSSGSSNSPGHHHYPRSLSQFVTPAIRLKPGESSDSGFCSSPALTTQTSNATNQTANVSTWPPHSQDGVDTLPPTADRPHTISTAYEKGHQRPPLTVYTFQNPETIHESGSCLNNGTAAPNGQPLSGQATPATQKSPAASLSRPPLPVKPAHVRCSSLERPLSAQSNHRQGSGNNLLQRQCPSPIPAHITKELSAAHHAQQQQQQNQQPQTPPTYVNMSELATMAALKQTNQQQKPSTPPLQQQSSIDSTSSQHSNDSTGSHQLLQQQHHQSQQNHHSATATRSHSISSTASSLHSHPSIDSTVACGSLVGQHNHSTSTNTNTTSPSSGSSTPQNHYSPLLTNSPTSTAAGTPSGSSLGPGSGLGFVYQVSSPTPPSSEVLKITEQAAAGQDQGPANSVADETDERSRASVLQKASMFEKAAAAAAVSPPAPIQIASGSPASGGGTRRSEAEQQEMDKSFEDSIQALNNLIGELDSFQREIDEGKVKPPSNIISGSTTSSNNNNTTTSSISSSDNNNLPATSNIEPCAISNQTNSSGCGTDISDTTSDELAGDDMDVRRRDRDRDRDRDLLGASDSELSRCYVSETSSLTGGLTAGGYENPTFAHFAANANREDAVSLASDSVCLGQPRHAYVDTCSDSGSAVVVIYDHQIPNTPDIEFVKQNSEIVVLRTKDPQPHALQLHEMRELQQLPANLAGSPDSSPDSAGGQPPPTATVAPAKQRLSSFRATSEQQLQLLGRGSPQRGKTPSEQAVQSRPQDQHFPQTQQQDIDGSSPPVELARRQLPPKPTSLSIFNGPVPTAGDRPVVPRKSDFKADLDAKIRRQKLKVKQQLQQQQQQQQETQQQQQAPQEQQHSPQSPQTRNCNVTNQQAANITASASESASAFATATASTDPYPNPNHRMPNQNQTATSNHTQCKTPTMALSPSSPRGHLPLSSSSLSSLPLPATTSSPSNARPSMLPASDRPPAHPYVCSNAPANPHHANSISNGNAHLKPCITPRPASLSGGAAGGGSTRIGRRSSINQAKPPPPVRRSSSVTPSPNASVGLQQQPQHATLSQQNHQLSSSSEHLPPPPPFMLDAMPQIPSSALKVSETVRALAAMRHQPASPVSLRRMQQQQQQQQLQQQQVQQQQPLLQSAHNSPLNEDLTVYYDSYLDLHAYAQALASGQQPGGQQMANQQRFTHQQQHQHLHQPQPQPPPVYQVDATFRTSSPAAGGGGGGGIYAQPKLVNSMSSFRTSSPSPNGHAHPLPPTQPKANPNLIAQLNARLSGKQQQQHVEGIYGNQQAPGGESIYMRSGLSMSQPQQQQHYDAAPGSANSHYQPPQPPNAAVANSKDMAIYSSSFTKNPAAAQSPNMRQAHSHQHHQPPQQQHYTCPPPLEDPPPPPIYAAGASATMPKKMARPPTGQNASHSSAYAAASSTATLPKNMMQQQQQQQRLHQQYQQPTGMGIGNGNGHLGQRPQLPLPQQKLRAAQQQHLAEQQQHQLQQQHHQQQQHQQHQQHQQRQPPIPSRHSSVQQKIFVSTNPFIQTTAVKFHSPSASPTCGSPVTGSLASIYATTSRGGHHHQQQQAQQQQQHHYRDAAGGNSNGGAAYYNHNAHAHSQAHHPNYATSTNIEKTGSIRAKTKAEFLENLNAKLAKQGMSGRAFAVRNLINSKALMYQNPQKLSRPSAQYRRPPTYPNTSTTTNATCEDQC